FIDFWGNHIIKELTKANLSVFSYIKRLKSLKNLNQKTNCDLVTFLDNHDEAGSFIKKRIATLFNQDQHLCGLAMLIMLPGTPCLYYGTEINLEGEGQNDCQIRYPMFNSESETKLHNTNHETYKFIQKLNEIRKEINNTSNVLFKINSFRITNKPNKQSYFKDKKILCVKWTNKLIDWLLIFSFDDYSTIEIETKKNTKNKILQKHNHIHTIEDNKITIKLIGTGFTILKTKKRAN
ncbi:MAG: alpha-amylase family glycosyl hydrolase, partial [Cytophagales bacterium]